MSRESWNLIKRSKHFYVKTYRSAIRLLLISIALNLILCVGIYYAYFDRPDPDFYSTNGITPPVELTPLDEPNYTSVPLLANDPEIVNTNKVIPQ